MNTEYLKERQLIENKYNIIYDKIYKRFYEDIGRIKKLGEFTQDQVSKNYSDIFFEATDSVGVYPNDQGFVKLNKIKVSDRLSRVITDIYLDSYDILKKEYDVLWTPYKSAREQEYIDLKNKYMNEDNN